MSLQKLKELHISFDECPNISSEGKEKLID